jgi:hypothetical protein
MNPEFEFYSLNEEGVKATQRVAELFNNLLDELDPLMGFGRYNALVRTKLEEASFFAKKSLAVQKPYQKA